MIERYDLLLCVLSRFIGGFLCPDRRSKGLLVDWGWVLERMMLEGTKYAWGSCMLAICIMICTRLFIVG